MLPKRQRLSAKAFSNHFSTGRRIHGHYLTLIVSPGTSFHGSVVVGKKIDTRAVVRNRLRRRLYGVIYHRREMLEVTLIVLVKPVAKGVPYAQVREELERLLLKLPLNQVQ